MNTLTNSTKTILTTALLETASHQATLEQLDTSLTETTSNIQEFRQTHKDALFLDKLSALEQKLRTIENAKGYVKALLVASELR